MRNPAILTAIALLGCNQPPGGQRVSITPAEPTTIDDLTVNLDQLAEDENDDVLSYRYAWFRDGGLLAELDDVTVPAARTKKGEEWRVEVTAFDGKLVSETAASAAVTIANTAPTLTLSIAADRVGTEDDIVASVETGDIDEDTVSTEISWSRNGSPITLDSLTVPASMTAKGDIWEVTVTPTDGEDEGISQTLAARVINTAPEALGATLTPSEVTEASEVRCLSQGWRDVDGDEADYFVSWVINGEETGAPGAVLTGEWFDKGDTISCILVPWDGEDEGPPVTSESVTVQNSAPWVAAAHLDPAAPTTTDDLTVVVDSVEDPDGDLVDVTVRWTVDGRAVGTGPTLDASRTSRGQRVEATVIPFDGEVNGTPFTVGPVVIANTPPVMTSVALTPSTVRTGDTLRAVASATDVDFDTVTLAYSWTVNGRPVAATGTTLDGRSWFDKGDTVSVTVTPSDGADTGTPMTSSTVTVANSPPTAPSIRITPTSPTASDVLRCQLTAASSDADGDPLTYTGAWTRNGSAYSGSTTSFRGDTVPASATRSGETWTCVVTVSDGTDTAVSSSASVKVQSWKGRRTFTNCGKTGQDGPSSTQCSSAYSGTTLAGEVTVTGGKQVWTVPVTGTYRIEAQGAQGKSAQSGMVGGKGARMRGDFYLTAGTSLTIVVGQLGTDNGCSGGGGGGTYVARGTTAMLVAGGGGGTRTSVSQNGCDGRTSQQGGTGSGSATTWGCGAKATSTIGAGGIVSASSWGSGGGAWSNNGGYEYSPDNGGRSFTNGSRGGGTTSYTAYGGFGGAGAGNGGCGGGGGGYSGGDGGRVAGGGGSYNTGSSASNTAGARSGHGTVTIDLL